MFATKDNFEIITLEGITKIHGLGVTGLEADYYNDTILMENVETIMFADQTITIDNSYSPDKEWHYWGTTASNTYDVGDGNDVIDSGGGDDTIDGGTGDDTLLLFATKDNFEVVTLAGLTKIHGLGVTGLEADYYNDTITMTNVETIMFADQTVTVLELSSSSASANAINGSTDDDSDNPTNPEDDDTPITPTDDNTSPDIELPDLSLFVNDFDISFIILPETVTFIEDSVPPDLSGLVGLLDDQMESLALDFDAVDADTPVVASVESVKPVIVDWIAHTDPLIDSDWNPIIEEWYYTSEAG